MGEHLPPHIVGICFAGLAFLSARHALRTYGNAPGHTIRRVDPLMENVSDVSGMSDGCLKRGLLLWNPFAGVHCVDIP